MMTRGARGCCCYRVCEYKSEQWLTRIGLYGAVTNLPSRDFAMLMMPLLIEVNASTNGMCL